MNFRIDCSVCYPEFHAACNCDARCSTHRHHSGHAAHSNKPISDEERAFRKALAEWFKEHDISTDWALSSNSHMTILTGDNPPVLQLAFGHGRSEQITCFWRIKKSETSHWFGVPTTAGPDAVGRIVAMSFAHPNRPDIQAFRLHPPFT